jgi:Flp pilus assembly pilin Flp
MNTLVLKSFWQEEDGQDLVEYTLLLAFIALCAVALLNSVSGSIQNLWKTLSNSLTSATTAAS